MRLRTVQFTVDGDTIEKLEYSQYIHGDTSLAQTFRRAAATLNFFDRSHSDGFLILVRKHDDTYIVSFP